MISHRAVAAAALCLLFAAAPARAAPTGFELEPGVTPEQVGACYVTMLYLLIAADEWKQPRPPVWTRLRDYFEAVGNGYGPADEARAKAAARARVEAYKAFARDNTPQQRADRLAADAGACAELVIDLE